MTVLAFSLTGEVRGKGRPRATMRGGYARLYTDDLTRKYEKSIRDVAQRHMLGRKPFEGPLSVSLRFRLTPPQSMSKRQRARLLAGEEAYFGRVDADNACKSVQDALNGIVWIDDVQVMRLFATKIVAEVPGIDIRVEALGEP